MAHASHETSTNSKNIEAKLVRAQAIAGSLFFIFLIMHLGNTLLAALGPEYYDNIQRILQTVYQQPLIELGLVIIPLLTHAIAGVWLYSLRRKRRRGRQLRYQLQSWAGLFLLLVIFGHVLATRGVGFWLDAAPGFSGVSFSLWWMPAVFYPYYFLLFMAGLYHGTMGMTTLSRRTGMGRAASNHKLVFWVTALGTIGATLALLGFGGFLFDIHDPTDNDFARAYGKLLNVNLVGP